MSQMIEEFRDVPCPSCPYRKDVPPAVWHPDEYDKLVEFDAETMHQPPAKFLCHWSGLGETQKMCRGWGDCHSNRGHHHELLALRIYGIEPPEPSGVEVFGSGEEARANGLMPLTPEAEDQIDKIVKAQRKLRRP